MRLLMLEAKFIDRQTQRETEDEIYTWPCAVCPIPPSSPLAAISFGSGAQHFTITRSGYQDFRPRTEYCILRTHTGDVACSIQGFPCPPCLVLGYESVSSGLSCNVAQTMMVFDSSANGS
jgi:hypothetical protein